MTLRINVISNYVSSILNIGIKFLLTPIYIKYLTIDEFGLISFFASLTSVFIVLDLGISLTINKEVARAIANKNEPLKISHLLRTYESIYWFVAFFIFVLVAIFSNFIANIWLTSETISKSVLNSVVFLMGVTLLFKWPVSFYNNALAGFQKMVTMNVVKVFFNLLNVIFLWILFKLYSIGILGYFYFLIILSILNILMLIFFVWNHNGLNFLKAKFIKDIFLKGKDFMLGSGYFSIVLTFFVLLDKLIISKFFTLSELGYYSIISTVSLGFLQLAYPISSALFPKFVEKYALNKSEDLFMVFRKGYQILMALIFILSSLLFIFNEQILYLWLQDKEVVSRSLLFLNPLLMGTVLYGLHILIATFYTSLGKTKALNQLYTFVFVIYVCLLILAVLSNDVVNVAYAWLIANIILLILSLILLTRLINLREIKVFIFKDFLFSFTFFLIIFFLSFLLNIKINNFGIQFLYYILIFMCLVVLFSFRTFFAKRIILKFKDFVKFNRN